MPSVQTVPQIGHHTARTDGCVIQAHDSSQELQDDWGGLTWARVGIDRTHRGDIYTTRTLNPPPPLNNTGDTGSAVTGSTWMRTGLRLAMQLGLGSAMHSVYIKEKTISGDHLSGSLSGETLAS